MSFHHGTGRDATGPGRHGARRPALAAFLLAVSLAAVGPGVAARGMAAPGVAAAGVAAPGVATSGVAAPGVGFPSPQDGPADSDTAAAVHLLRRATFGVRPQDLEAVLRMGRKRWLEEQLHPERLDDSALEERLARFPTLDRSPGELSAEYPPPQLLRARLVQEAEARGDSVVPERLQGEVRMLQRTMGVQPPGRILFDLVQAKLQRAVYSERQLQEVMTDFWFNHFNVFWGKAADRYLVGAYEREAIRPHVFGRFEDLLVATASHPAMLVYLDNWRSTAPDSARGRRGRDDRREEARRRWAHLSPAQRRALLERRGFSPGQIERAERAFERARGRRPGINENYARELLELHTLGVDGGYTQQDVVEVSRAFTGWTLGRAGAFARDGSPSRRRSPGPGDAPTGVRGAEFSGADIRFAFRPELHDAGEKVVLGHTLPPGRGMEDGLEVLRLLAHHPSTARHIATKLARAFVSDSPPEELVDELARVFRETDGDLREVTRALFTSDAFYDPAYRASKVKTPFQLVASALRATGAEVGPSRGLLRELRGLGQLPYANPVPTGYPETSEEWTSSGAMLQRMNFAVQLAEGRYDGVRLPVGTRSVDELLSRLLPGTDTRSLARDIEAEIATSGAAKSRGAERRALALALGSPAFQKR